MPFAWMLGRKKETKNSEKKGGEKIRKEKNYKFSYI